MKMHWYSHPRILFPLSSGVITTITFFLTRTGYLSHGGGVIFYSIAIAIGGYHWMREGITEFFDEQKIGIEILMMGATGGAIALGMWDEAGLLVFLYGIAEGLEEYTFEKTRRSIRALLDLTPKEVSVITNEVERKIPVEEIKIGDIFIVRPGEAIPTDGIVIEGCSSVNDSPVTGESIPVEKKKGNKVYAGSINQEGLLKIQATSSFEDNTISRIIHLVEEAQERKSNIQNSIERFGRIYSPLVLITALLMIVVPQLAGGNTSYWAIRAVVLLVAAAPCALIISTPVTMVAGIGNAGRKGVLIKGGVYLEALGKIKAIAFDKTGTLTRGEPTVTDVIAIDCSDNEVLAVAASVERYSEHPLARAIVKEAEGRNVKMFESQGFGSIPGYGAYAIVNGKKVFVGKEGLFKRMLPSLSSDIKKDLLLPILREGKTGIGVGDENRMLGFIAVRDELKEGVKEIIETLHREQVKAIMLTGDNLKTALAIASEAGIDEVKAELKPEDKAKAIKELKVKYGYVAMVGDGINDAPALSEAPVGIAMGTGGTDAAIEAADVALIGDNLTNIIYTLKLGRKVKKIILQNLLFSISILIILIPLALTGWIGVTYAVIAHEISELLAVANGLRVGRDVF